MKNDQEILDRTRRIETRLTRFICEMGFDAGNSPPQYDPEHNILHVASRHTSLQDCLKAIPTGVDAEIQLEGEVLGYVGHPE